METEFVLDVPKEFEPLYRERPGGIVKFPNPVLRRKAKPVQRITPEINELIDRMIERMDEARGIGLAAPQLGVGLRVIIVAPSDREPRALINPQALEREGSQQAEEGCLSIPAFYGEVIRPQIVTVRALNRRGKPVRLTFEGIEARVAMHEIDHLDGVLFIDRAIQETLHWHSPASDDESDEEQAAAG
ncbi:MAG: peptide deformylase [Armatimonadetes bacterium]|nr:peptide deformylase [Armatimonadota bacterium]